MSDIFPRSSYITPPRVMTIVESDHHIIQADHPEPEQKQKARDGAICPSSLQGNSILVSIIDGANLNYLNLNYLNPRETATGDLSTLSSNSD